MTALVREAATFREDLLVGFADAYARYVERVPGASGVRRVGSPSDGKVSLIIGGGCGHYPAFMGYVGTGLADAAVVGDVFTSPSAKQAYEVAVATDGGAGTLFSFGNYAGDNMNFGVAQERLRSEGMDCRTVVVTDDVASAPAGQEAQRRGVGGIVAVFKAAGAAAARGANIDEVERIARKANNATRTIGVAFAGCTLPGRREPLFVVKDSYYEVGLGIHGEPGVESLPAVPVRELAEMLVEKLLMERPASGQLAAVLLNGLGATKYEELFVLWQSVTQALANGGVRAILPEVGELVTSLDMAGCSLSLCWLDDELQDLWCAPVDTPSFRRGDVREYPQFQTRPTRHAAREDVASGREASEESVGAAAVARLALEVMLETIVEHEDELGRLDAVAGDGDHGSGMARGMRAAKVAAEGTIGGVAEVLRAAGRAFADEAGGASGLLWGSLLEAAGRVLGEDPGDLAAERVRDAVRSGVSAVQRLGGAKLGDKTLLDVLIPFVDALSGEVDRHEPLPAAWAHASAVAETAAGATASLTPKVGRARPLAARSIGSPDAGAVSLSFCLSAVSVLLSKRTLP